MSPRRLLVVIAEMEVAGSQRQIVHLLTALDRRRWQPELVFFRDESFLVKSLRNAGIPVHHVPKRGRLDLRFLWRLSRLLRRGNYDLIQAFSLTAELWTILARSICGHRPPFVASERNQQLERPAWYWRLKRFVLVHSVAAIANSEAGARTTALHTGIPLEFFDTIANGVPVPPPMTASERATLRAGIGAPAGRPFALFVGRLAPQKNLDCLINAMALVAPERRPWLALAGDGPLRDHAQQLATVSGVAADLRFLGERSDATGLMQAADFLVLPSHFEGLSNALLEAMAAGCPVIASAVGGNPELIEHERTGLLFPPNDTAALAACLARMASDHSLRSSLSRRASEYVSRTYGVPVLVAATAAVYDRCLAEQTARRPRRHAARSIPRIAGDGPA